MENVQVLDVQIHRKVLVSPLKMCICLPMISIVSKNIVSKQNQYGNCHSHEIDLKRLNLVVKKPFSYHTNV